ncbi:cell wall hydrolase [Labrys wisconsinensis]|uniref:Spore germination cell wall hydrolase CwlJ-like protein n=1 Tax=Labrys wisconsinensis TaxID=425677 RepID=A0ABU0JC55_9HYPH|nr:cell wall hydrolase [Labrys wisconsinensis]MDQ0471076.1 spore germination cell wall hydrolase CwlJ-like protein [Labrys wisconsinensis]
MSKVSVAFARIIVVAAAAGALGGCATVSYRKAETDERLCLARAMFFESNRSSDQGMLAVGTVVMNRRASGSYPGTICGVVGQPRQFAPGALTNDFQGAGKARALRVADAVLAGRRQPGLEGVYHFHTAGYTFPYTNMHYVMVAGGNAFYQKRPGQLAQNSQPPPIETQMAAADAFAVPAPRRPLAAQPVPMSAAPPLPPPEPPAVAAREQPLPPQRDFDEPVQRDLTQLPQGSGGPLYQSIY